MRRRWSRRTSAVGPVDYSSSREKHELLLQSKGLAILTRPPLPFGKCPEVGKNCNHDHKDKRVTPESVHQDSKNRNRRYQRHNVHSALPCLFNLTIDASKCPHPHLT